MKRSKRDNSSCSRSLFGATLCAGMCLDGWRWRKLTLWSCFFPDSRGASSGRFTLCVIYFNPKYEKKNKKINTQLLLGFLGVTETKLSHWTVVRIYDDGWTGRGKEGLSELPPLLCVNEKSLFLGLIFKSRSIGWPCHWGPVLIFLLAFVLNITIQRSGEWFLKRNNGNKWKPTAPSLTEGQLGPR